MPLTAFIEDKSLGAFTSPSKKVSAEREAPPSCQCGFPNCLNDFFPFSEQNLLLHSRQETLISANGF